VSTAVIDLNVATAEDLTSLPGVGPKRAEAILARRAKAPFTRVTQLLEVKGIGKRTLDRLKPHLWPHSWVKVRSPGPIDQAGQGADNGTGADTDSAGEPSERHGRR
jgi:competence protein ComEA